MASITKLDSGKYRALIYLTLPGQEKPFRQTKTFPTKREATLWAHQREQEILAKQESDPRLDHTLRDALRRYADEVSPTRRGARWEQVPWRRLKATIFLWTNHYYISNNKISPTFVTQD